MTREELETKYHKEVQEGLDRAFKLYGKSDKIESKAFTAYLFNKMVDQDLKIRELEKTVDYLRSSVRY